VKNCRKKRRRDENGLTSGTLKLTAISSKVAGDQELGEFGLKILLQRGFLLEFLSSSSGLPPEEMEMEMKNDGMEDEYWGRKYL